MKNKSVLLICILLGLASCKVPKDVAYFQDIDELTVEQMHAMSQEYSATICEDDLLTITVTAWDPSVVTPFNPPTFAYSGQGETSVATAQHLQTYLVDKLYYKR